jgi:dihydroxyacetone kinase|tara:strand:- start:1611 stop:2441 length:831 start_codon:yes stop_codon:yes gene_type:complete
MVLDTQRLGRIDAPVQSAAWPHCAQSEAKLAPMPVSKNKVTEVNFVEESKEKYGDSPPKPVTWTGGLVLACVVGACKALQNIEKQVTDADTKVGDGDCGTTFARGASGLLQDVPHMNCDTPRDVALAIGLSIRRTMGGTAGALYDIFFAAAGVQMGGMPVDDPETWFVGFEAGVDAMRKYGNALPGNRTMLDALVPALEAARVKVTEGRSGSRGGEALEAAACAAEEGAVATRLMAAGAGRSSYVPKHVLLSVQDPGATASAAWLRGCADAAREYL